MTNYRYEIKVYNEKPFYSNAVVFATNEEADRAGASKLWNWTMAEDYRVVETDDPVNYAWEDGVGVVSIETHMENIKKALDELASMEW